METQERSFLDELPGQAVFALDIGTRSIIGMVGILNGDKVQIVAIEKEEHTQRAMIDGQIENIDLVAGVARTVKERLEKRLGCHLTKVAVAAAGRSLRTEGVTYEMELAEVRQIDAEVVSRLEAGAISEAERSFFGRGEGEEQRFYLVGYSVSRYYLDGYLLSSLVDHRGRVLKADVIATFLPAEVVESLYAAMRKIGLEISSLTLEPIAAINAAIPANIRLLNLALVDIGAGTSDIAVCRDGCITGYTMAVLAGDEITESIMKAYLVDFQTAEEIKAGLCEKDTVTFTDIMGIGQTAAREEICGKVKDAVAALCREICDKVVEANGGPPSAIFLSGGGSLFPGVREGVVKGLDMDSSRVAIAGRNFAVNASSEGYDLENPEYATPLGIVISASLNMINDSFRILLNGEPAKLFRSGTFTVMNILMMNGYGYQDMMGKSGQNLVVFYNRERRVFYGEKAEPCILKKNGEDAQLSDMVQAGDRIDFTPVRHGTDASAMLSDLTELEDSPPITINGKKISRDVALKSGDVILVEGMYPEEEETVKPDKKRGRAAGPPKASGTQKKNSGAAADRKKRDAAEPSKKKRGRPAHKPQTRAEEAAAETGPQVKEEETAAGPGEEVRAEENVAAPQTETPVHTAAPAQEVPIRTKAEEMPVQAKAEEMPVYHYHRPAPEPEQSGDSLAAAEVSSFVPVRPGGQKLLLYLNDRTLVLPPKADGSPYYLMDMLEYSGLDLERVTAPVILEINGRSGTFQQELKTGDSVRIYEQPSGL